MAGVKGKSGKYLRTELHKKHLSERKITWKFHTGPIHSEEQKKKWSFMRKGTHPKTEWKKGRTYIMSEKHKKKIGEANKKSLLGNIPWNKGMKGFLSGEKHYNWTGEKYKESYRQRRVFRDTMQKDVFERDKYKCVFCGSNKDLQVDHIQSWAHYVELRFDINNCRTLCAKCHYKITFGREMPDDVKTWGHNFMNGGKGL